MHEWDRRNAPELAVEVKAQDSQFPVPLTQRVSAYVRPVETGSRNHGARGLFIGVWSSKQMLEWSTGDWLASGLRWKEVN